MLNSDGKRIYLACGATDMRNSIDGLAAVVQNSFKLTPTSDNAIFIFCNANRNRLKILEWDTDGFWLHYKRLERGQFPWPEKSGDDKTMSLSQRELELMLDGVKLKMRFDRINLSGRSVT